MRSSGESSTSALRQGRLRRRAGAERALDFELNLASVIDCLVVLIAFVLISASFVSIGVLDGELAANSASAQPSDNSTEMVVSLRRNHMIEVAVSGQGQPSHAYRIEPSAQDGAWNYNGLADRLALVKDQWPSLKSAVLLSENGVAYREVIKSMEVTRLVVPAVSLGGI